MHGAGAIEELELGGFQADYAVVGGGEGFAGDGGGEDYGDGDLSMVGMGKQEGYTLSRAWLRPWNVRRSLAVSRSEVGLLFLRVEHDAIRLLKTFVRAGVVGLGLPLLRLQGNEGGLRCGLVLEALLPVGDLRL